MLPICYRLVKFRCKEDDIAQVMSNAKIRQQANPPPGVIPMTNEIPNSNDQGIKNQVTSAEIRVPNFIVNPPS